MSHISVEQQSVIRMQSRIRLYFASQFTSYVKKCHCYSLPTRWEAQSIFSGRNKYRWYYVDLLIWIWFLHKTLTIISCRQGFIERNSNVRSGNVKSYFMQQYTALLLAYQLYLNKALQETQLETLPSLSSPYLKKLPSFNFFVWGDHLGLSESF